VFYVTLMLVRWGCDLCGCVVVSGLELQKTFQETFQEEISFSTEKVAEFTENSLRGIAETSSGQRFSEKHGHQVGQRSAPTNSRSFGALFLSGDYSANFDTPY